MSRMPSSVAEVARGVNGEPLARQQLGPAVVEDVLISRYSWNLYQQMIGSGLRGPLNGGSNLCTIVNVADNLSRFGLELAYREFEYLWS